MVSSLAARRAVRARKSYVQPSREDVHVNRPLTNISVAWMQENEGWVADKAFPVVKVAKRSDRYFTYNRGDFNRNEMQVRAPSTESAGATYRIDNTPTYYAEIFALHKDIPDQVRDNADEPLDLDREATIFLSLKALIHKEVSWASNYFVTGKWATEFTGVAGAPGASQFMQWDNAASTPIEDIRAWRTAVKLKGGLRPNKLVLGTYVWNALMDHPDIVARIDRGQTPVGPAVANREALAALFELDEILVMDAIQNTAIEGATESNAFIGAKNALLIYAAKTPGLMTPTAGYTFSWTGMPGANSLGGTITKLRAPLIKSDRIEIEQGFSQNVISTDLGFMALSAVA